MVAGEASGDFLGSHLIEALKTRVPHARFAGIGGPKMGSSGFDSWFPMEKLAVRGYVEVLRHYPEITGMRRQLARRMLREKPSVFIGIDAPDFNLVLEERLKRHGIPTVHYVSPSVWAWRGSRVWRIARAANQMLVLFPFEADLYRQVNIPVAYVGHPLADVVPMEDSTASAREQLRLSGECSLFALLPGSRQSELKFMAATFVSTA